MPLYAYRCKDCNHEFEVRQRFSDDPLTECPECAGQIRRVINSVGIVFKGSGFYVTDNPGSKGKVINGGGSSSGSDEGKSDKSDSSSSSTASSPTNQGASSTATAGAAG